MSSTPSLYTLKCEAPGTKLSLAISVAGVYDFVPGNVYTTSSYDEVLKAVQSGYFVIVNQPNTEAVAEDAAVEAPEPAPTTPAQRRIRG